MFLTATKVCRTTRGIMMASRNASVWFNRFVPAQYAVTILSWLTPPVLFIRRWSLISLLPPSLSLSHVWCVCVPYVATHLFFSPDGYVASFFLIITITFCFAAGISVIYTPWMLLALPRFSLCLLRFNWPLVVSSWASSLYFFFTLYSSIFRFSQRSMCVLQI